MESPKSAAATPMAVGLDSDVPSQHEQPHTKPHEHVLSPTQETMRGGSAGTTPPPLRLFADTSNLLRLDGLCAAAPPPPRARSWHTQHERHLSEENTCPPAQIASCGEAPLVVTASAERRKRPRRLPSQPTPSSTAAVVLAASGVGSEMAPPLRLAPSTAPSASRRSSSRRSSSTTTSSSHLTTGTARSVTVDAGGTRMLSASHATQVFPRRSSSSASTTAWLRAAVKSTNSQPTAELPADDDASAAVSLLYKATAGSNRELRHGRLDEYESAMPASQPSAAAATAAASTLRSTVATASRVLFLPDGDDDSSRTAEEGCVSATRASHGGSLSSRSPSGVSCGTAVPERRTESFLMDLLTRASSVDGTAATAQEEERGPVESNVGSGACGGQRAGTWSRTPVTQPHQSLVHPWPVTAALGQRDIASSSGIDATGPGQRDRVNRSGSRGEGDGTHLDEEKVHSPSPDHNASLVDWICSPAVSQSPTPQQQPPAELPTQPSLPVLASPSEALRFSFPSLSFSAFPADGAASRSRGLSKGTTSPSQPLNLFSDSHICAAELPDTDALSLARMAAATAAEMNNRDTPAEALDMSSFRTPLSPCPSSVAPPFSVFPCAATSRVTSPVSIPAKMMKQRQREHARVRNGSTSPASQYPQHLSGFGVPLHLTGSSNGSGGGSTQLTGSQRQLRESFSSIATTGVTSGSLFSASASGSHELADGDALGGPSALPIDRDSGGVRAGERKVPADRGQPNRQSEGDNAAQPDCTAGAGTNLVDAAPGLQHQQTGSSTPLQVAVSPQQAAMAHEVSASCLPCVETSSGRRAAAVALRISLPESGTSTPPQQRSPRLSPQHAGAVEGAVQHPSMVSPLDAPLPSSAASVHCAATPWSPVITTTPHERSAASSLRPSSSRSAALLHSDQLDWSARFTTATAAGGEPRSCSPPLRVRGTASTTPSFVSGFRCGSPHRCFLSFSHDGDSGARTPATETTPSATSGSGRHPLENLSFTPHRGGSARPASFQSPIFLHGPERRWGGAGALGQVDGLPVVGAGNRDGLQASFSSAMATTLLSTSAGAATATAASSACAIASWSVSQHVQAAGLPWGVDAAVSAGHGVVSTCSTPPPAPPLLSSVASTAATPCKSPEPSRSLSRYNGFDTVSTAGAAGRGGAAGKDLAARVDRRSPSPTAAPLSRSVALTSRMSRNIGQPRRPVPAASSPSPPPRPASASLPHCEVVASSLSTSRLGSMPSGRHPWPCPESEAAAAVAERWGSECYGVETELCGLQTETLNVQQSYWASTARGEVVETAKGVLGGQLQRVVEHEAVGTAGSLHHATACEVRAGQLLQGTATAHLSFYSEQLMSDLRADVSVDAAPLGDPIAANNSCSRSQSRYADDPLTALRSRDSTGMSGCYSSPLQLVPPPPLVALPGSSSSHPAPSHGSLTASMTASLQRQSRRGSPLLLVPESDTSLCGGRSPPLLQADASPGHDEALSADAEQSTIIEGEEECCDVALLEEAVAVPRVPASVFHYAFSSLRGARSRQEDSVTLAPGLLLQHTQRSQTVQKRNKLESAAADETARAHGDAAADSDGGEAGAHETTLSSPAPPCLSPSPPVSFTCFGVFDGHCGDSVSLLASQYFPEHFEFAVREYWSQWAEEQAQAKSAALVTSAAAPRTAGDDKQHAEEGEREKRGEGQEAESVSGHEAPLPGPAPAEFQRVISAALVQALVHLDLTLYDALHQRSSGRPSAVRKDAGSTASVATLFRVPTPPTRKEKGSGETGEGAAADTQELAPQRSGSYRLCIANLGDSRAIIGNRRTGQVLLATTDHRISTCPAEESRIAAAGGVVELGRVDGSLDVTRGLGDYRYKVEPSQWWGSVVRAKASAAGDVTEQRAVASHGRLSSAAVSQPCAPATLHTEECIGEMQAVSSAAALTDTRGTGAILSASIVANAGHSPVVDSPPVREVSAARALQWSFSSTTPILSCVDGGRSRSTSHEQRQASVTEESEVNNCGSAEAVNCSGAVAQTEKLMPAETAEALLQMQPSTHAAQHAILADGNVETDTAHCPVDAVHQPQYPSQPRDVLAPSTERELFTPAAPLTPSAAAASIGSSPTRTRQGAPPPSQPNAFPTSPLSPSRRSPTAALTANAVSNVADVYEWEVQQDDVLIIASDGVWDTMTSDEVLRFVCRELQDCEEAAGETHHDSLSSHTPEAGGEGAAAAASAAKSGDAGVSQQQHQQELNTSAEVSDSPLPLSSLLLERRTTVNAATGEVSTQLDTPTRGSRIDELLRTPPRQPTSLRHSAALCTPCGVGGGYTEVEGTPGRAGSGSVSRASAVQTAARHLTEHVVNTLSGNDNTTAIVVVFQ